MTYRVREADTTFPEVVVVREEFAVLVLCDCEQSIEGVKQKKESAAGREIRRIDMISTKLVASASGYSTVGARQRGEAE